MLSGKAAWNYEKKVKFPFSKTTVSFFYELIYIFHSLNSLCLIQVGGATHALPPYVSFWLLPLSRLRRDKSLHFAD